MKMIDMGVKEKPLEMSTVGKSEGKNKVSYPSFSVYKKVPEFLTDKDVGHKCRIEIEVEVTGKSINDSPDGKRETVDLRILKMGYIGKAGKITKDEYLSKSEEEREEYDKKDKGI